MEKYPKLGQGYQLLEITTNRLKLKTGKNYVV